MRIYLSGPISGRESAHKEFEEAEKVLIEEGYEVVNPFGLNHDHNKAWESYMKTDIEAMMSCDAVACLEDWFMSTGAGIEVGLASNLNMPVHSVDCWKRLSEGFLCQK